MELFTESVHLAAGVCLQASATKFRVHRRAPWESAPFAEALAEKGDPAVTRQLMAGAFYAGFQVQNPAEPMLDARVGVSLLRHVYLLAGDYQTNRATPPIMRRVAEHFTARGRDDVAARCLRVAKEETGHDTLALNDLAALGLPARELVARLQPPGSIALVNLFTRYAESAQPIAVFGYAYVLERTAMFNTAESIEAVERLIPAGIKATRCLRVHSSVGSDAGHVAESIEFMATLPAADRATIARAIHETSGLVASPYDYPGDATMQALLDELTDHKFFAEAAT